MAPSATATTRREPAKTNWVKIGAPIRKAILAALSERDEEADICRDKDGNPEPDAEQEFEQQRRGVEIRDPRLRIHQLAQQDEQHRQHHRLHHTPGFTCEGPYTSALPST